MILVQVFVNGEFRYGSWGVEYSISPRLSFRVNSERNLEAVKGMIYRKLGYSDSEFNLNIYARCNVGTTTGRYYELVQIVCDETWRSIYEQTMGAGTQITVLDLYIEFVPIVSKMSFQLCDDSVAPETQPEPCIGQYCDSQAGPSQT